MTNKTYKKIAILLAVSAVLAISGYVAALNGWFGGGAAIPEDTMTQGLVGYWSMDEGAGQTAFDASGNSNNGTLGASASSASDDPKWTKGKNGGGLKFDGKDDYVNLGQPATLFEEANYTFIVWFKVGQDINGNSGTQNLINRGSRSDILFGVADSVGTNGDLSLHYYDYSLSFHALSVGQTVWSQNDWHVVTATKDSTIGHKIYLDGILKNSDSNTSDDNLASRNISIGAAAWIPSQYFNGFIDEVRIYNRALSAAEVRYHYNHGGPVAEWKFDEGSGTTIYDSTENNKDGVLHE